MDKAQTTESGWQILVVERSERNGRFYVWGVNHESTDPLFREFSWHVDSLTADSRYWLDCDAGISAPARELLARHGSPEVRRSRVL